MSSAEENAVSPDVELIKYELEGVRDRFALLQVSLPEEIDSNFQNSLESDISYLLSLVDHALGNNPRALLYDY